VVPDLSVLWVIFFVLLLTALVNYLLFKPITSVIEQRELAIRSARKLAEESNERARNGANEFERETAAARAKVYAEMDVTRRQALEARTTLLNQARQEAEQAAQRAASELEGTVRDARARLEADAATLGDAIVHRVLDAPTSSR
jgi:F-type H+-transporting ATPase subunit b